MKRRERLMTKRQWNKIAAFENEKRQFEEGITECISSSPLLFYKARLAERNGLVVQAKKWQLELMDVCLGLTDIIETTTKAIRSKRRVVNHIVSYYKQFDFRKHSKLLLSIQYPDAEFDVPLTDDDTIELWSIIETTVNDSLGKKQ